MKFGSLHTIISYLLAALGLVALTLGSELSLPSAILLALAFFASMAVGPKQWNRPGYTKLWNGILLGFLAIQVGRGFLGSPILALGMEFAGFLQVSRLFHRRTAKDHQHIQTLAFLHLIAATVLSTGLDYAVVFFGFVLVTPWMLAFTHMRVEIENHYGDNEDPNVNAANPRVQRVLESKRIAGPGFLAGTAALSIPLFVVTAAFFLLFPRVGMGFLSFGGAGGRAVAGFGGNVELGDFGVIRDDPTVVVRVRPENVSANPPPYANLRLRGTSFDRYSESQWTRSLSEPERFVAELGTFPIQRAPRNTSDEQKLQMYVDPIDEPVLFLPDGTIALDVPPRVENAINVGRRLERRPGLDIRYTDGDGLPFLYTAIVARDAVGQYRDPATEEDLEKYLQLPEDPAVDRVRTLTSEVAGEGTVLERARNIEAWLSASGEFQYSLAMLDTRGRDPLEVFLFEAKSGHCEYFSTALAVMLRTQNIPARNVTGFVGGVWNDYGNYYAISQGDAHSWVEVYVDGYWFTLEPTPAARGELPADTGMLAELRAIIDALRTRWSQSVVGYDLQQQVSALRGFYRWLRSFRADEDEETPDRLDDESRLQLGARSSAPVLVALILVGILALVAWWLRRRRRGSHREMREATSLYAELERALRSAGHERPPARTPREHAETLRDAGFHAADAVDEVTEAYLAARWGNAPLNVDALRRRVREVRRRPR